MRMKLKDHEDEMEKVGETEMIETFHKLSVELMYSPPQVTEEAKKFGLRTGAAMDLTAERDFQEIRSQAESKGKPERTQAAAYHRKPDVCHVLPTSESLAVE